MLTNFLFQVKDSLIGIMLFRGNQKTVKIKKGGLFGRDTNISDAELKEKFETVSSNIGIKGEEERILLIYKQKGSIHAVYELFMSVHETLSTLNMFLKPLCDCKELRTNQFEYFFKEY